MQIDRVELSQELSAFVAERIANYATEYDEKRPWLIYYVEKYNILPLFTDWSESIGILPDGSIRQFSTDDDGYEHERLRPVARFQQFMVALVRGAKTTPGSPRYYPPARAMR